MATSLVVSAKIVNKKTLRRKTTNKSKGKIVSALPALLLLIMKNYEFEIPYINVNYILFLKPILKDLLVTQTLLILGYSKITSLR